MKPLVLFLIFVISRLTFAGNQDAKFAALPKGTPVIASGAIEQSRVHGDWGYSEPVAVSGSRVTQAVRIRSTKRAAQPYQFQLRTPTNAPVRKGAKLLAVFDARVVEPQVKDGAGQTEFVFEQAEAPYTKSVSRPIELESRWQRFYIPFEAKLDHEAGRASVIFRAAYDAQTIEIAGVQVLDFGADLPFAKLPYTPPSYVGRDPGAPWRKEAEERIERIRKSDLKITVTDASGKPLPGATVQVRMKRHAFGWGTAVDARTLLGKEADNERYRQILLENFNKAVLENDLKWDAWSANRQPALDAITWLREREFDVRGHVLVWPGKTNLPTVIHPLLSEPERLQRTILDHITEEVTALRGQLTEWDVVNEPYTNFDVQTTLTGVSRGSGSDWIERHASTLVPFFKETHQADPGAQLYINDYSILETGGKDAPHQEHYERTIRQLLGNGAPLQGIGIQGHFSEELTPIPRLWEILDRFGAFALPIQITEFDINTTDEILQSDYTRDFLTAMFAHKSVEGVLIWGFWEKRHWIPNAAPYRGDWSMRPAAQAWIDLVQKQWRTDANGVTDSEGNWKVRGFHGRYEITATFGGLTATVTRSHMSDQSVVVKLDVAQ